MRQQNKRDRKNSITLAAGLVLISLSVTLVTLGATSIWSYSQQQNQEQSQMLTEARLLDKAVFAAWRFIDNQQVKINTDADGSYNFKGIYCSLVGKSVGKIFSLSTESDYELKYVRENPRNRADAPDSFETEALTSISAGVDEEYYGIETKDDGERYFRYLRAIRITEQCMDCHGGQAGEIDVTGFEKEGMSLGDIGGAVSLSMPMAEREADVKSNTIRYILFTILLVSIIVAIFTVFIQRYVRKPLNKLKRATADIGEGSMSVSFDDMAATREVDELADHIEVMAEQLGDLYDHLEEKIDDKTRQYQRANEQLSIQKQQISQVNKMLSDANASLQEENEYRANILSMMNHELRTPITAIMSFTELWEKSLDKAEVDNREYAEKIRLYSQSLLQMVNNTLDMAHFDAGKVQLMIEDVDFVDLVNEVELVAASLAQAKGITLSVVVERDVPLIRSDWDKIHKIIINLVSNAIKFTDFGGCVSVRVHLDTESKMIGINVKDTGIGIEEEELEKIFDRFVQVDSSISRKYGGTGLGLALVREVVILLGGTVSASSSLGEGSEFVVLLPFQKVERDDK